MLSSEITEDKLLYREIRTIKAGEIERFKIHYASDKKGDGALKPPKSLWVKVKNIELIALRAAYLAGPYVLYVDCKTEEYDPNKKCFITADQPVFEPQLLPAQSFYAELSCHTIKESYNWTIDVVSQIIFNKTIDVDFEITIGTSKSILHDASLAEKKVENSDKRGKFVPSTVLNVENHDTLDLWNLPLPDTKKPIHLVILTHGLHSNVSVDMLYLKEQIDKANNGENIVVKGYFGNIGKTERGIKYLGSRVAEYIVDLVTKNETYNNGKVAKISFIGHSLGGLVQTFAIAYLQNNFAWFFKSIKPVNFITIASPLLGVVNENPAYVKMALLAGVVGKTGQELGLKLVENDSKPLLLLLPTGPTHRTLKMFVRRTVYGNVANDGIVPLRTSALLYLDYKGLTQILKNPEIKKKYIANSQSTDKIPDNSSLNVDENGNSNDDSVLLLSIQAMFSYFMPQKQRKKPDVQYQRFQTKKEGKSNSTSTENDIEDSENNDDAYDELPKSSFVEAATTLILPPLPPLKYITDPDSRDDVVVHDKVYHENDLPPRDVNSESQTDALKASRMDKDDEISSSNDDSSSSQQSSLRQRFLESLDVQNVEHIEEEIAREYHKNMSWRKVLVNLKPDAHNNIIVRRRFANAYGWPVIDHIVKNHFKDGIDSSDKYNKPDRPKVFIGNDPNLPSSDSLDAEVDLSDILSRDLLTQQNDDIDKENEVEEADGEHCEHGWINSKDNSESLFAVGPTGLLSDVSEMVGNLRDQWYNYNGNSKGSKRKISDHFESNGDTDKDSEREISDDIDKDGDLGLSKLLMGNFI
ncbi:uncharacterized protein AC631_04077 [Debaryomyces fabryi]|uniref:DUF676 domain-containing protein n=1 Tax=Debaryomyces fabryi TaxID=58627 RepID=A0A0V1PVE4_9ASCO|nr:uncharacterized protein AC631_04077 [Debaryomyces fabryi]KSA00160.1 hypothetical protein AC631_04077 [Debaryomyces fabryi]CUM54493.1 unnamed protein product [Debaryomyces fabryi]